MGILARKVQAEAVEASEYEAALVRFNAMRAERRKLMDRLDAARTAWGYIPLRDKSELPPVPRAKAEAFLDGRDLTQDRVLREIVLLEDQIREMRPLWAAVEAEMQAARSAEVKRRVAVLKPRHDELVEKIAEAVQSLSNLLVMEQALQGELAAVGGAMALPDASFPLGHIGKQGTPLAVWATRHAMREAGR